MIHAIDPGGLPGVSNPGPRLRSVNSTATRTAALYAMVTAIHRVLLHAADETSVMQAACELAVERGDFLLAWIGLVDPSGAEFTPVASAGVEVGYLKNIRISTGTEPEGRGPTGSAVRTGRHVVCNDIAVDPRMAPWRVAALGRGFHSSAAFPLRVGGRTIGAFTVYAPSRRHFGRLEIEAMDELTSEIAYALNALQDAQKKREAEEGLAASEVRLRQLNEELERRVAARTAELEASNRELEAFSYSVSHDLREPLRAMSGYANLLEEKHGARLDGEAAAYVHRINAAANKMNRLIDALLQFSRTGRAEMKVARVDPTTVARAAADDLREDALQGVVEIVVSELPDCMADAGLLQHVYANLISNAIKFSAGRPSARVEIGAHEEHGETVYDVRDNGLGFDMRYVEKLFGVFQRLHSDPKYAGTGVGLALVQRIVQRHGGRVWAEGTPDKGACFHFTLGEAPA
jgi:signal transduction histidine kinase